MRKILRNIARANMRKAGMKHINKRNTVLNPRTGMPERMPSLFAQRWREFC